jgi:hypothetical protein
MMANVSPSKLHAINLSLIWPGVDELPVLPVNQVMGQGGMPNNVGTVDEFILTFGYLAPPVLLGSPEDQATTAQALGALAVDPLFRMAMSRSRLDDLIKLLQESADKWDALPGQGGNPT